MEHRKHEHHDHQHAHNGHTASEHSHHAHGGHDPTPASSVEKPFTDSVCGMKVAANPK